MDLGHASDQSNSRLTEGEDEQRFHTLCDNRADELQAVRRRLLLRTTTTLTAAIAPAAAPAPAAAAPPAFGGLDGADSSVEGRWVELAAVVHT